MTEFWGLMACWTHCIPMCLHWTSSACGTAGLTLSVLEPPQSTQPLSPGCQSSSELRAMLHAALTAGHLTPHSLPFPRETRLNHRAEQCGVANPNCAGSQSCYGGKGLSSRIPIPRLPAIFIPTQLTANAGGFLGLRCSTRHSEMCSFTQDIAGSGVHFFVLWNRAAADGLSYSQAEQGGQEWLKSVWKGDVISLYVHGAS